MACKPAPEENVRRALDNFGCISFQNILDTFNAAINQEQAWAVCFQFIRTAKACLEENRSACFYATQLEHVKIHKDGSVHRSTFLGNPADTDYAWREPVTSDCKLVAELGLIIYKAVDYGLEQDVERKLDNALGNLIYRMVPSDPSTNDSREDDEGIEQDAGETDDGDKPGILDEILMECINNLNLSDEDKADLHYKPVCRALVTECMDLVTFLEKVGKGAKELKATAFADGRDFNVHDLHSTDWERLWVQVIKQLRDGVKLKKVDDHSETNPVEFELSPYEMLMKDIRSKRYKLNKVPLRGGLPPKVKEDAHEIILDFIRSRPPLKKVTDSERLPARSEKTLHEELMEAIRSTAPSSLKPTRHSMSSLPVPSTSDETDNPGGSTRRRITVDNFLSAFDESDESDTCLDSEAPVTSTPKIPLSSKKILMFKPDKPKAKRPNKLESLKPGRTKDLRRYSSESIVRAETTRKSPEPPPFSLETPSSKSVFQEALMESRMWQQQIDCLTLTLDEVVHIRSVLTRAELETLLFDMKLYKDVATGKVCFSCRKTRFGLFGSKDYTCKLCEQVVCRKCCAKMEIPLDHIQTVPVFFLSPPQSGDPSPVDPEAHTGPRSLLSKLEGLYKNNSSHLRSSASSAPNSPKLSRSNSTAAESQIWRSKSPQVLKGGEKGSSILKRETMNVCTDCQVMVKQIILSSQKALRAKGKRSTSLEKRNPMPQKSLPE